MLKSFRNPLLALAVLVVFGVVVDQALDAYVQLLILFAAVNCMMAMSLNFLNGYTGQFSLGQAGFMAVGSYFAAYASTHWDFLPPSLHFLSFSVIALGGGLLAALVGFVVGLPSLRLKGDYLAIVTLGFGEIIRVVLLNMDSLGGPRGYANIPTFNSFLSSFSFAALWLVICFYTLWRILHSSYGRASLSVREDEVAAESLGINTTSVKVRAFVLSSFFAGVAGAMYAHFTAFINPSSFSFLQSINAVIMVVLGGMGSMTGSIVAAIFITALPEVLRPLQALTGVDLRMVIYSFSLILIMILRPKGLLGDLELSDLWRKYVRRSA